jgi:hypothetical protein
MLRILLAGLALSLAAALFCPAEIMAESIYRWVDEEGVVHLSSEKPPKGVDAERITVKSKPSQSRSSQSRANSAPSASQVAGRRDVLGSLQLRECVIALEGLERLTRGTQATSASELQRLQQTADRNCSRDPAQRREQERLAEQLKVANSLRCIEAREVLAGMLDDGSAVDREQLRVQQDFVAQHCTSPVH